MMKKRILFVCFMFTAMIFMSAGSGYCIKKVGKTGLQFLKLAVGARPAAMGEAFVGVADDISAIFWNPAALPKIENVEAQFSHSSWFAETSLSGGAAAVNLGNWGVVGFDVIYMDFGSFEETTILEEEQEGTGRSFDASDICVGFTYARMFTDKFSVGARVKYVREKIDTHEASTWAVDFGTFYQTGFHSLKLPSALMLYILMIMKREHTLEENSGLWICSL